MLGKTLIGLQFSFSTRFAFLQIRATSAILRISANSPLFKHRIKFSVIKIANNFFFIFVGISLKSNPFLTLQCLVSTKRSQIFNQSTSAQIQNCFFFLNTSRRYNRIINVAYSANILTTSISRINAPFSAVILDRGFFPSLYGSEFCWSKQLPFSDNDN